MTQSPLPQPTPRLAWPRLPRWALALVGGLVLAQLAGCAARLWPPSDWALSVDLPFARPAAAAAPVPPVPPPPPPAGPAALKDPTNASEALAYAEALCALPAAELEAEIERLRTVNAQEGPTPLRAQQLAFAQQLAQLYAEQGRLQESNERQAQLLRERQRQIEQLNGQIEAMRAVEYSLPAASTSAVPTPATTTSPVAPIPSAAPPAPVGRSSGTAAPAVSPKAAAPASRPPATGHGSGNGANGGNGARGNGEAANRSTDDEEGSPPKVGEDTPPASQP